MSEMQLIARQFANAARNKETWGGVFINLMDFGIDGRGRHDDTSGFQWAFKEANAWSDSGTKGLRNYPDSMEYRGAIILMPRGIYNVGNITNKSGVILRGSGMYSTRINPIGTSGFTFGRDDVEEWMGVVGFEDFTIAPTDEHFAFTTPYASPPAVGGIDLTLTSQSYMNRVNILNIGGMGIRMQECYDSYFSQMELINVGADENHPAIGMYPGVAKPGGRDPSVIDVTNAIHMSQIRVENCPRGLEIDGQKNVNKLLREIQLVGCKFEKAPGVIKHVAGVTVSASNTTVPNDANIPAWTIGGASLADTRGVQFDSCSYFSGSVNTRWVFNVVGVSTYDFSISTASVTNVQKFLRTNAFGVSGADPVMPIRIDKLKAINCGTDFIKVGKKLRLSDSTFYKMQGTGYAVSAGDSSRITGCDFIDMGKGISWGANGFSKDNTFTTITDHAHYVTTTSTVMEGNIYESGVATPIAFTDPNLALNTYNSAATSSIAPAGYNEYINITAIGTNNTYPAAQSVPSRWNYFTVPQIMLEGTNVPGETITFKIEAIYEDLTTAFVEKIVVNGLISQWLTTDELLPLIKSKVKTISYKLYVKSNTTNPTSLASCHVRVVGNMH